MNVVGIVAEFNPMHTGHKYLIEEAKKRTNADVAICIMSGNFTQAGNIAIKDKFYRAKVAIENGFDVVIELPTIYATASAQYFARGAIEILNALGCVNYLAFGSETADTSELITIANILVENDEQIWQKTTEYFKDGISFAKAHERALSNYLSASQVLTASKSNNILAIEYIRTLILLKSTIIPVAIKRVENSDTISATKIRELIDNNNIQEANKYCLYNLKDTISNNNMLDVIKYSLVSKDIEYIENINEVTEGLENVLVKKVDCGNNYNEFIQEIKSKRYQLSKIKRIFINTILDITKKQFDKLSNAHYAHILAVNKDRKKEVLSLLNSNSSIPIITSINDKILNNLEDVNREALQLDIKATNIHSIFSNDKQNRDYTNML